MVGYELAAIDVTAVGRVVRALGAHRYVAGRAHHVHAFAFAAVAGPYDVLAEAQAWAGRAIDSSVLDIGSRDERLWRASSEAEIAAVLEVFWGPERTQAHERLHALYEGARIDWSTAEPFCETAEETMFPMLIDAGWELLPLTSLDHERHKGVIQSYGEPIQFEVACFEEESAVPPPVYLQELSAFGARELTNGVGDDGSLTHPFVVWCDGPAAYVEYVLRGVARSARISEPCQE